MINGSKLTFNAVKIIHSVELLPVNKVQWIKPLVKEGRSLFPSFLTVFVYNEIGLPTMTQSMIGCKFK